MFFSKVGPRQGVMSEESIPRLHHQARLAEDGRLTIPEDDAATKIGLLREAEQRGSTAETEQRLIECG